ncbi:MAG: class I SAM-dependent methyltransferase, partial [Acidithiobacillus sp.]
FNLLPRIGELIAKDRESYQYLVESIRRFPDQETFKMMMEDAGLERVEVFNLSGGIVALHRGFRMD